MLYLKLVNRVALTTGRGQHIDLMGERGARTPSEVLAMQRQKTASVTLICECAALYGGVSEEEREHYRVLGENPPEEEAVRYAKEIKDNVPSDGNGFPVFDWIFLGMGEDGHTASLFPGSPALDEERRWVMAVHAAHVESPWRITLTPAAIERAAEVTVLVSGAAKAARVAEAIEGRGQGLPVQRLRGAVRWMMDAAAAAQLRRSV